MHADKYFKTGKIHSVCEDYAIADNNQGFPIIVLSDGCSSSMHTDVGARILAHCCRNRLKKIDIFKFAERENFEDALDFYEDYIKHAIWPADATRRQMNLPEECLDATLLIAFTLLGEVIVSIAGDGVFAVHDPKDNLLKIFQIKYLTNAPYYLSYQLDPQRSENFKNEFTSTKIIKEYTLDLNTNTLIDITEKESDEPISHWHFYKSDYDVIALFSDGVETFRLNTSKGFITSKVYEIISELINFKTIKGSFIQRRCKSFFKHCTRTKMQHDDDFSMAAIYLGN